MNNYTDCRFKSNLTFTRQTLIQPEVEAINKGA